MFHVKIVNTVLSIDNIDDDVTSKAHPRNLGKGNALDTKSGEARDSPHSRSSTFQVTGGLTYVYICLDITVDLGSCNTCNFPVASKNYFGAQRCSGGSKRGLLII